MLLTKLRNFDAYPKTQEDFRIKTPVGAFVSVISFTVMLLLFWIELVDYLTPHTTEELFVDTTRSPKILINMDLVFPQISCDFLALDAMDLSGEQHLEIDHNIFKRRLDLEGNEIDEPIRENITISPKKTNETTQTSGNKTECGSCYGASLDPNRCCNTCEQVREAYRERRWAFPDNPENIEQCKGEKFGEKLKLALTQGCRIYGHLTVNRVGGSFHVAPGKSFSINHVHVHDVQPFSSSEFNTTHRINHLTFGAAIESEKHNPLKGAYMVAEEGATMFQYHIKIVPIQVYKLDNTVIDSNQFSVTKHKKVVSIMSGESGMPGVFFQYELSPLMVKYTERQRSFGHYLTTLCAIIGGVYTVASLVDSFLHHSIRVVRRKIELGKLY